MSAFRVLLVHGMGSNPSWWTPFLPALQGAGFGSEPILMPDLAAAGPAGWCQALRQRIGTAPVILAGHSLGAAICLQVALTHPPSRLIALSLPAFVKGFTPRPPRTDLPASTVAETARFLRATLAQAAHVQCPAVHLVGDNDPAAPLDQVRQMPWPHVVIPNTGHQLNRQPAAVTALLTACQQPLPNPRS